MKLKHIDIQILKILINNKNITVDEIKSILNKQNINIKTTLDKLNNFLNKFNYGFIHKLEKKYILKLNKQILHNLPPLSFPLLSSEERINYLMLVLSFERKINLREIADNFKINRNTLVLDIKNLKSKLKRYNLGIYSVPWQGIYLTGNSRDIYLFSIKFILKLLIEKEFNQFIYTLHLSSINPFIKIYYDRFISNNLDLDFSTTSINILKFFNIELEIYGINTIKSLLIFLYLNPDIVHIQNLNSTLRDLQISKKLYSKIYNDFLDSNLLTKYSFLSDNINFFIISILKLQKKIDLLKVKNNSFLIIRELELIFDIKFNLKNKIHFLTLLETFEFNFLFDIYNYNQLPKNDSNFPEFLIKILKKLAVKYNYNILSQDFYTLTHFIYSIIFPIYIKKIQNKRFLILDNNINKWAGNNIKFKFEKYFKIKNIEVFSIYMTQFFNFNSINSFDFIIISSRADNSDFLTLLKDFESKIIILDFLDYFEFSSIINKIFLEKCVNNQKKNDFF